MKKDNVTAHFQSDRDREMSGFLPLLPRSADFTSRRQRLIPNNVLNDEKHRQRQKPLDRRKCSTTILDTKSAGCTSELFNKSSARQPPPPPDIYLKLESDPISADTSDKGSDKDGDGDKPIERQHGFISVKETEYWNRLFTNDIANSILAFPVD